MYRGPKFGLAATAVGRSGAAMSNNVLRDRRTMDTIATFQADKEAVFTPKLGEVRPIDIFSHGRRELDERVVNDLEKAVDRDGNIFHPPAVRDEGEGRYRLIHGHLRLEAWKRCRGEQTPIPANIYPPHTPDALITILQIEENVLRRHLTAAERERQTILLAAALKKLDEERSLAPVSASGETGNLVPRLASAAGGRGNKGVAQRVAEKAGITKRAVRKD